MAIGKAGLRDGSTLEVGERAGSGCGGRGPSWRPAADAAWPCCSWRASTALCAAPEAGLNRHDLARPKNTKSAGEPIPPGVQPARLAPLDAECRDAMRSPSPEMEEFPQLAPKIVPPGLHPEIEARLKSLKPDLGFDLGPN